MTVLRAYPFFLAAVVISSLPNKRCPNRLRRFWERREEEIGLGITAGEKKVWGAKSYEWI